MFTPRPSKGKSVPEMSLAPVGERLAELLDKEVLLANDYEQEPIDSLLGQLGKDQLILLENLRFILAKHLTKGSSLNAGKRH